MKIGIDLDDTVFITVNSMIKYADLYDKKVLKRSGTNGNLGLIKNRYYLKILYGWDDKTKFGFFNTYYKNVLEECVENPGASEIIRKLKSEGHEIYFITARLTNIDNCDTEKITIDTLRKYNIPYNKLIINASDKLKVCLDNNIEVFIEDSFETCKELQKIGIKSYLKTTQMNKEIESGDIERFENWNELYEKINLLRKKKNVNI